jgi:hypothetical protein
VSPGCLLFFLEGRRWMADIRRFERTLLEAQFALPARVPPHERERGC